MEKKEFYINFSGYCVIKATSKEKAERIFWAGLQSPSKNTYKNIYNIDLIEKNNGIY